MKTQINNLPKEVNLLEIKENKINERNNITNYTNNNNEQPVNRTVFKALDNQFEENEKMMRIY